jgi:hypothetical protein
MPGKKNHSISLEEIWYNSNFAHLCAVDERQEAEKTSGQIAATLSLCALAVVGCNA